MATCSQCHAVLSPVQAKYCGTRCKSRAADARRKARRVADGDTCERPECPNPRRSRGLCTTHYNQAHIPDRHLRWPGDRERIRRKDRAKTQRRRAATRGVTVEAIDTWDVGERDGWRCGVCRRRVNQSLAYPDPLSPSLDHVVPLAEGGHHVRSNVRITHLRCNVARGDRGGGEQLALLG